MREQQTTPSKCAGLGFAITAELVNVSGLVFELC